MGKIIQNLKKPNPLVLEAVIAVNQHLEHIPPRNQRVLMVGDAYWTDIVGGNLAGVDTALVNPYQFLSQPPDVVMMRSFDKVIGEVMSKLS